MDRALLAGWFFCCRCYTTDADASELPLSEHMEVWSSTLKWYRGSFEESFAWGRKRKEQAHKKETQEKLDALQGMVKDAREATHNTPEVGGFVCKRSRFSRLARQRSCLLSHVSYLISSRRLAISPEVMCLTSCVSCHGLSLPPFRFRTQRSKVAWQTRLL